MISNETMNNFNVQEVWSCSKKEDTINIGFNRALSSCQDGVWLVVLTNLLWEGSEVETFNKKSNRDETIK